MTHVPNHTFENRIENTLSALALKLLDHVAGAQVPAQFLVFPDPRRANRPVTMPVKSNILPTPNGLSAYCYCILGKELLFDGAKGGSSRVMRRPGSPEPYQSPQRRFWARVPCGATAQQGSVAAWKITTLL